MNKDYRWLLIGPEHPRGPQSGVDPSATPQAGDEVRLFARGHESIRILIRAGTSTLQVFGPGRLQKLHEFPNAAELHQFLRSYEKGVVENGWTLLDVADRRIANRSS
jgi:hypothetical protein